MSELAVFRVACYAYLSGYNSVLSGCVPRSKSFVNREEEVCNPGHYGGENLCLGSSVCVLKRTLSQTTEGFHTDDQS
jgi:hypothetical protein